MSEFPIHIDATQLFYRDFFLLGPEGPTNTLGTEAPRTFQLAPGSYRFQFGSGMIADFNFTVTDDGTVTFDTNFDTFLVGRDTSTLIVRGLEVTIDALHLTGADTARQETGVLLNNTQLGTESNPNAIPNPEDWIALRTIHLLPATGCGVIVGSALVASFSFNLKVDGTFDYISSMDSSQGGFLAGKGTNKLTFLGYLLTVDATAVSDLLIIPVRNFPPSHTGKADAVLLPLNGYPMQLASGAPSNLSFNVELNGNISFDASLNDALKLENQAGKTVLRVQDFMSTLTLPFSGAGDTAGPLFSLTNTGTGQVVLATGNGAGAAVFGVAQNGEGVHGETSSVDLAGVTGISLNPAGKGSTGVFGKSNGAGAAVFGVAQNGEGVHGETSSADVAGVAGISLNPAGKGSTGVFGKSNGAGAAVFGVAQNGEGVHGETSANSFVAGVTGIAMNKDGVGPGVLGQSNGSGPGVFGTSIKDVGVMGFHGDPRLQETTVSNEAAKAGVFGASDIGAGVLGYSRDPGTPAIFAFGSFHAIALNKPLAGLFDGNVQVNGDIFLPGADCAEHFDVADVDTLEPGTVMVINNNGILEQSCHAYDRKVAGVISGAGNHKTGIVLDKQASEENRKPIALIGKVNCKVDATYSPIEVGDLLTTSLTPGHAMKASEPQKAFGSIIGKALRGLREGQGLIPILIALH